MTTPLHELHQRRLATTVHLLEQSLDRIEHLVQDRRKVGIVGTVDNTLSDRACEDSLRQVRELRRGLEQFAADFGLERRAMDIRQLLNAELSTAWVMLENCRPKRMKGYGVPWTEEARRAVETSVEGLLQQIRVIQKLLQ